MSLKIIHLCLCDKNHYLMILNHNQAKLLSYNVVLVIPVFWFGIWHIAQLTVTSLLITKMYNENKIVGRICLSWWTRFMQTQLVVVWSNINFNWNQCPLHFTFYVLITTLTTNHGCLSILQNFLWFCSTVWFKLYQFTPTKS